MGEERSYWHTSPAQSSVKKRHANMGKNVEQGRKLQNVNEY